MRKNLQEGFMKTFSGNMLFFLGFDYITLENGEIYVFQVSYVYLLSARFSFTPIHCMTYDLTNGCLN